MPPPQLPTELIVSVAEFLAGAFAYRSLAQLNLVSHAIHEETLPVLYETVVWETDTKWWIHHRGHVPRGWKYTRYLVTTDLLSGSILRYFSSLAEGDDVDAQHLERIFPRLVMSIIKEVDEVFTDTTPIVDLHMTLYKPITATTFLLASTTRMYRCKTTIFGAEVQPALCPVVNWSHGWQEEPVVEERIAGISFEANGQMTGSAGEREGWYGQSIGQEDLVFEFGQDCDTRWVFWKARETFQSLFSLIPPRRSGDLEPYRIQVTGSNVDTLASMTDALPFALSGHVSFDVPVWQNNLSELTKHLTTLSRNYVKEWHRLGKIASGKTFFRTDYHDRPRELDDGRRTEHYVVVGTLTSLDPSIDDMEEDRRQGTWDGFKLVINRYIHDNWIRRGDHPRTGEAHVLLRKTYYPVAGSDLG